MEFVEEPGFTRECKRLCKRYRSLAEDFADFCEVLRVRPRGMGGKHWNLLSRSEMAEIFKTRIICLSLGRDAIRIVYAFHEQEMRIVFLELYYKGDKEREDQGRVRAYLKDNS